MAETHLYLTELVGMVVFDLRGRRVGRIQDAALVPMADSARVDQYLIGGGGWSWMAFRHYQVKSVSLRGIELGDETLTPYHADADGYTLRLVRDLLDQQIIDAQGRKVVRVTDVTFHVRDGRELHVMEVDIGLRSVIRRLLQGIPPRWVRKLQGPISVNSIPWTLTNILEPDPQRRLRLNITTKLLEQMHPADLADIVEELSPDNREAIIEAMDSEHAAETLAEVEPEIQASILESLEAERAAEILEEMPADAAADVLAEMEEAASAEIMQEMAAEDKTEVAELLEFAEDTAGGMMTTEYLSVPETATVTGALAAMRELDYLPEAANSVFLVDSSGRPTAWIPAARMLLADPNAILRDLPIEEARPVSVDTPERRVTELFDKYNLLALPVADSDGAMAGVITASRVIAGLRRR
ncbi:MAG: magnesium transporter [Acidobacteria bacterium]|nr:magnesium transporter [Acidobacteriota bacterium]